MNRQNEVKHPVDEGANNDVLLRALLSKTFGKDVKSKWGQVPLALLQTDGWRRILRDYGKTGKKTCVSQLIKSSSNKIDRQPMKSTISRSY